MKEIIAKLRSELEAQPAPRTYEVARALSVLDDYERRVPSQEPTQEPVAITLKDALPVVVKELRCAAARIGDAGLINEAVQYGLLARELDRVLGERK